MDEMGVKIDQFDDPVCNSFQAIVQNDKLCYEVDLNKFSNEHTRIKALKSGFRFLLDYNEDRVVTQINEGAVEKKRHTFFDKFNSDAEENRDNHVLIYLDTIGKKDNKIN